jgi:hypothetical protein
MKTSFSAMIISVFLPLACIAAARVLMRLFDVKDATPEQAKAEAEKLLMQVNQEVTIRRRVRAGAPSNAILTNPPHGASLGATRLRFPSA